MQLAGELSVDGAVFEARGVADWYQYVDGEAISYKHNMTYSVDGLREEVQSLIEQNAD